MRENLCDLELGKDFSAVTPKSDMIHKRKTGQIDFIKLKNFLSKKCLFNRMKRQTIDWDVIFVQHVSDKLFLPKLHQDLSKFSNKKTKDFIKGGDLKDTV